MGLGALELEPGASLIAASAHFQRPMPLLWSSLKLRRRAALLGQALHACA